MHEAWLRLVDADDRTWESRAHFFGAAAGARPRILIENARRKSRSKRGGGQLRVDIDELNPSAATPDDKILLMDEALERLEAEDPEKARIVVLKFFGGLTNLRSKPVRYRLGHQSNVGPGRSQVPMDRPRPRCSVHQHRQF